MPDYTVAAVKKAMRILCVISDAHRLVTLTEVAKTAGLSKNAVFRVLKTMEGEGFVAQSDGKWSIGQRLWGMIRQDIEDRLARWQKVLDYQKSIRRKDDGKGIGPQRDRQESKGADEAWTPGAPVLRVRAGSSGSGNGRHGAG